MIIQKKKFNTLAAIFALIMLMFMMSCATADTTVVVSSAAGKNVDAGSTWVVDRTASLSTLTIGQGAGIKAPDGKSLTMTVDSIQKDILSGTYKGDIVLTVSEENAIQYKPELIHKFRHALYVDKDGINEAKSVLAAVQGGEITDTHAKDIKITSDGAGFNGIYVAGGIYTIEKAKIDFKGNGKNDFCGFASGIMATGVGTVLYLNDVDVKTKGVVRTALIPAHGSKVIVRNSRFESTSGTLDPDYTPSGAVGYMREGPWGLGITGNVRTQNVIGKDTKVTYINSYMASDAWGVLSVDDCDNVFQNIINSKIENTKADGGGYGVYAIGNATNYLYGTEVKATSIGLISVKGHMYIGASNKDNVNKINKEQSLGLTEKEIASLPVKESTVNSKRYGVMFQVGSGDLYIGDGTVISCGKEVFVTKSSTANINVDGAKGVKLTSGNGVILQEMEIDRPSTWGAKVDPYVEPYATYDLVPVDETHDNTVIAPSTDVIANFSNIELKGDFYNATIGGSKDLKSRNMGLTFKNAGITGVIASSFAKHPADKIYPNQWYYIGDVTNTAVPAKNNGVIVSLDAASTWTVTGTSYLSRLDIVTGAIVTAPKGYKVTMTVDGAAKEIKAGSYKGKIVLTVAKS